jgi:hypothetical protein
MKHENMIINDGDAETRLRTMPSKERASRAPPSKDRGFCWAPAPAKNAVRRNEARNIDENQWQTSSTANVTNEFSGAVRNG